MGVFKPGSGPIGKWRKKLDSSYACSIVIVFLLLMFDNILLSSIVPVLPEYLKNEDSHPLHEQKNLSQIELNSSSIEKERTDHFLVNKESLEIGLLFAAKPFVQAFSNLVVGPIVDRIGFSLPIFVGTLIMFASSLIYCVGSTLPIFFIARGSQGFGSACSTVAGIAMLAHRYKDDDKARGKAIGIAYAGYAMGVIIGPPFASIVYDVAGKSAVFMVLAAGAALLSAIVLFVIGVSIESPNLQVIKPTSIAKLMRDPYILLASFGLMTGSFGLGMLEASLPLWMMETMDPPKWQLGVAFLPINLGYLAGVGTVTLLCQQKPRWIVSMTSFYLVVLGLVGTPFAENLAELILPVATHGYGYGLFTSNIYPLMAEIVDARHTSVYGSVYAIGDLSFCITFVIAPIYAGALVSAIGFAWLGWGVAIVVFLFAPVFLVFRNLKKPPTQFEEAEPLIQHSDENESLYAAD